METIKFVAMYGMEAVVIALVGLTLFGGIYQLVRDSVRKTSSSTPTPAKENVRR